MPRVPVIAIVCLFGGMALAAVGACDGDEPGSDFARSVSDAAYPLWLGVPAYYLLSGDGEKVETGRRVVDALALSAAATQLAKATINSRRPTPHEANKRGMPSGQNQQVLWVKSIRMWRQLSQEIITSQSFATGIKPKEILRKCFY